MRLGKCNSQSFLYEKMWTKNQKNTVPINKIFVFYNTVLYDKDIYKYARNA